MRPQPCPPRWLFGSSEMGSDTTCCIQPLTSNGISSVDFFFFALHFVAPKLKSGIVDGFFDLIARQPVGRFFVGGDGSIRAPRPQLRRQFASRHVVGEGPQILSRLGRKYINAHSSTFYRNPDVMCHAGHSRSSGDDRPNIMRSSPSKLPTAAYGRSVRRRRTLVLVAEDDAALGEIVSGHFHRHPI